MLSLFQVVIWFSNFLNYGDEDEEKRLVGLRRAVPQAKNISHVAETYPQVSPVSWFLPWLRQKSWYFMIYFCQSDYPLLLIPPSLLMCFHGSLCNLAVFPPKYGRRNMENGEEEEDDDDRQSKPKSETRCASMHAKFIRRAMQCFNDEREGGGGRRSLCLCQSQHAHSRDRPMLNIFAHSWTNKGWNKCHDMICWHISQIN